MDDVMVVVNKETTVIVLKAGDAEDEPSEMLYDLLTYAQDAGNVPPGYKAFAKLLRDKMDAAIFGK